jgi:hypothetical protein
MARAMVMRDARIELGGHDDRPAQVEVVPFSAVSRLTRMALWGTTWVGGTLATLALTFDPFVASFPFVLGGAFTWKAFRNRFRVLRFHGECPRCLTPLTLEPGSAIALPAALVCYHCHHEPRLV